MHEAKRVVRTRWRLREACARSGGWPSARAGEVVRGGSSDGSGGVSLGFVRTRWRLMGVF